MISNFCAGRKLTVIFIDEMLAWTHRKQIEIRSAYSTPTEVFSSCGTKKVRLGTYREQGKPHMAGNGCAVWRRDVHLGHGHSQVRVYLE
jgi:hypothetical protein